ncbi:hypothetical protein GCM10010140_12390 [Streptosporangium pseudovulgare]|uniref:Uncharacterized protein n=1 Tax=Streptosporangium pseudovulgare TaxID=35765 RepID=A0ABQ2QM31_9ACTN|nr:hypothetical protein GCM10010140_12390 [Streptosporangium pseudovulgare]
MSVTGTAAVVRRVVSSVRRRSDRRVPISLRRSPPASRAPVTAPMTAGGVRGPWDTSAANRRARASMARNTAASAWSVAAIVSEVRPGTNGHGPLGSPGEGR